MTVNMLVFEYKDTEREFFENNKFDDFNIIFYEECLNEEFLDKIPQEEKDNAYVISVFINSSVTKAVVDAFKNLRIIATRSTGYDHIDLKACQKKNITVLNVVNYGETSVAQYTFGLIIDLVRNIIPASKMIRCEETNIDDFTGRDLSKMTLGVVGTGAIGAAVCQYAHALDMHVLAYDINPKKELEEKLGLQYMDLDELLRASDIVTLHIPYTGDNYHMFSKEKFEIMKDGSYFINTSRGEMVDVPALYELIERKKIKGAALDVLTCESENFSCRSLSEKLGDIPLECRQEVEFVRKLAQFDNVIITPHIAYDTTDSVNYILEKTMNQIKTVIKGDKTDRIV